MKPAQRAFWLRQLYQWHWISAALSLVGMLAFAITGITLNHAADIPATPEVTTLEETLPPALLDRVSSFDETQRKQLPQELVNWFQSEMSVKIVSEPTDWSEDEIYISMPRPGGDAWLSVDLISGDVMYEMTFQGWISFFNDLHKGRDTGTAWRWFIDIIAVACIIFCVTGLVIMQFLAERRPATWPLVGFGFIAPVLLIVLFIHS